MELEEQKSLKSFNTFGIDVTASFFVEVSSEDELLQVLKENQEKEKFILSGGSNMLLTQNIDALIIYINIKGIDEKTTDTNTVFVTANAGENWHEFVSYCIEKNYGGLENLSLIPGYVGSSPIQNIGAYGVEIKDTFVKCTVIDLKTGNKKTFTKDECNFGYRNSVFKHEFKNKYVITSVTFELTTTNHKINTSYGAIENALKDLKISTPTLRDISNAVISIRKSKLPDPSIIGNSGSFFKNPIISASHFIELQKKYPKIPYYTINEQQTKIPAGWLIEQADFKGKRYGDAGVHDKQALVLVNHGNASGKEILEVASMIQLKVKNIFDIKLETEVNIF